MDGGGALCENTSVIHPEKSDDPDIKDKLDDPHTSSDSQIADSAVCGEGSRPTGPDVSGNQQHDFRNTIKGTAPNSNGEPDRTSKPTSETHRSEVKKRREGSCGICLGTLCMLLILNVLMLLIFHHSYEDPVVIPELRVMMLGKTGAGKSASGNTILGRKAFKSETSALPVTKSCDSQSGVVEGRKITVTDTPAITSKAEWQSEKVDAGPDVFLLVIPLRSFTEEDGEEVKWIQSNFGEEVLKFTIVLFTGGDQMDHKNPEQFLNESSGLQTLVNSTGGYHIFDNKTPRGRGQVKGLLEKIELLLRKNMGYSYSHGLHEQVKTAVREEEERKRREEEEERKRLFQEQGQNMEKRIEQGIRVEMELKMITKIANATATLNELREVVKATTEQRGNCILEQVKESEEERKRREKEEEDKEEATPEQGGNSLQEQVTTAEREEEERKWFK